MKKLARNLFKTCHSYILVDSILIKKASKNDISVILDLLCELGRPKPANNKESKLFAQKIQTYLCDKDKQILVAKLDKKIVGFVSVVFLSRLNRKTPEMYIPELIITKNFQGMGIGAKILECCIKLAKNKKCHRIRLESGNQRLRSHKFYLDMGFEQTSLSFTNNLS